MKKLDSRFLSVFSFPTVKPPVRMEDKASSSGKSIVGHLAGLFSSPPGARAEPASHAKHPLDQLTIKEVAAFAAAVKAQAQSLGVGPVRFNFVTAKVHSSHPLNGFIKSHIAPRDYFLFCARCLDNKAVAAYLRCCDQSWAQLHLHCSFYRQAVLVVLAGTIKGRPSGIRSR